MSISNTVRERLDVIIKQKSTDPARKAEPEWTYHLFANTLMDRFYKDSSFVLSNTYRLFKYQSVYQNSFDNGPNHTGVTEYYNLNKGDSYVGTMMFTNVWEQYTKDSIVSNSKFFSFSKQKDMYNDSVGFIKLSLYFNDNKITINEMWELQRWKIIK